MPSATCTTARTTAQLASALAGFLATNALPDPATVELAVYARRIEIQPAVTAYTDPVAVLGSLLLWTRTLAAVTAQWSRTRDNFLHISIRGRLACGIQIQVYKSVPYDTVREWVLLAPGEDDAVSLDELAWLLGELHTARPAA